MKCNMCATHNITGNEMYMLGSETDTYSMSYLNDMAFFTSPSTKVHKTSV